MGDKVPAKRPWADANAVDTTKEDDEAPKKKHVSEIVAGKDTAGHPFDVPFIAESTSRLPLEPWETYLTDFSDDITDAESSLASPIRDTTSEHDTQDIDDFPEKTLEICFGAICGYNAAFQPNFDLDKDTFYSVTKTSSSFQQFHISACKGCFALENDSGSQFAILDLRATDILDALENIQPPLLMEAVLVETNLIGASARPSLKSTLLRISINIYGCNECLHEVGHLLSKKKAFLQHPYKFRQDYTYNNPHYFQYRNEKFDLSEIPSLPSQSLIDEAATAEVRDILNSLDCSDLDEEICFPDKLCTMLLRHQEIGVQFMLHQEDPKRNRSAALWKLDEDKQSIYTNVITKKSQRHLPDPPRGGILADVMGLGKTLTTLATIAYEMNSQQCSLTEPHGESNISALHAKVTLIIAPSSQIIDVWTAEMESHLITGTLRALRFHGQDRAFSIESLLDYDVILTTYSTLLADSRKSSGLLQHIIWHRVVLDEAHWIRTQDTKIFRAVDSLKSERRWCLTGTPIQNSLRDLASLIKFIKFEPFTSQSIFRRYIVDPLFTDSDNRGQNLRLLLNSICLRRSRAYIHVPPADEHIVNVTLSDEERALHSTVLKDYRDLVDEQASSKATIKRFTMLFTTILQLRRLCNHGTYQLSALVHETCDFCGKELSDTENETLTTCTICSEIICNECIAGHRSACQSPSSSTLRGSSNELPSQVPMFKQAELRSQGHSSKLLAVCKEIQACLETTKSLVFSQWTSTLDILEKLLIQNEIQPLRIDGRVSIQMRNEILTKFQDNAKARVLLMSIGTGAVGLNLTAAGCVHIIEPQWNPSVEEQAIGRAIRLGQTKIVKVIRYVTEQSVEKSIRDLQDKKTKLARYTFDADTKRDASNTLEELKFILDST